MLATAQDNSTGEIYGVVEDFDNSVYYPIEEYSEFLGKVRVIDKSGDLSVKDKSGLTITP